MLALVLLLASPAARAWGHHHLLTDLALAHEDMDWLDRPVTVQPLEALLDDAGAPLAQAIDAHYAWMLQDEHTRFQRQVLPAEGASRADFWRATRLNPRARLPLVVRRSPTPDAASHGFPIAPEAASPYLHETGGLLAAVEVVRAGQQVPARDVLRTFADEPDWGLDHELWGYTGYGYGAQPYGKPVGESSKAPFHMQFDHENFLTVAFSDAEEGMVVERIDLFLRLSRAAFAADHDYWGLRFAAWATHYAQDLCQPYHSKAIPGVGFGWYLGYVASPGKDELTRRITQIEANRHFVYEDFVATALQAAIAEGAPEQGPLGRDLVGAGEDFAPVEGAQALVDEVTGVAARHARAMDRALVAAFPAALMDNPDYDVETAPGYDIRALLPAVPPPAEQALLTETGLDFAQAGRATRTVLRLVAARDAIAP